jgi:hypothetical protein
VIDMSDDALDRIEQPAMEAMVRALESFAAERGWDAPWTLWALLADPSNTTVGLGLLAEAPTGHPSDTLIGLTVPEQAIGAALVTEGWSYPPDATEADLVLTPSEHPDRREMRLVHLVLRDGRVLLGSRVRDDDLNITDMVAGRIPDLMRRSLGAPVTPGPLEVGDILARMWLASLAERLVTDAAGGVPVDDTVMRAVLSTDPYISMIESGALSVDELAAGHAELAEALEGTERDDLTGTTDSHDVAGRDRLGDVTDAARNPDGTIDPLPASVRALLDERLGGLDGLWEMGCASGTGPYDAATVRWMGVELFTKEVAGLFDDPDDLITTIDAIAPLGGAVIRALLAARQWGGRLPDPSWAEEDGWGPASPPTR